jgi:uncharacterized membrane protein YphA (DoxX/SURF4 family)
LFDFSLIAVFVLRVTVGLFFRIFGVRLLRAAHEVKNKSVTVRSFGYTYGLAKLGVGLLLTVGAFTQVAALAGAILTGLTLTQSVTTHTNKSAQQVQLLLFILCLSLVFFGAGAFGVDLPL